MHTTTDINTYQNKNQNSYFDKDNNELPKQENSSFQNNSHDSIEKKKNKVKHSIQEKIKKNYNKLNEASLQKKTNLLINYIQNDILNNNFEAIKHLSFYIKEKPNEINNNNIQKSISYLIEQNKIFKNLINVFQKDINNQNQQLEKINLSQVIKKIISLKNTTFALKNINISLNIFENETDYFILADKNNIHDTLENLLDISRRNSPQNSIINVNLYKENDTITISIHDHGEPYTEFSHLNLSKDNNDTSTNNNYNNDDIHTAISTEPESDILNLRDILHTYQICKSWNATLLIKNKNKVEEFNEIIIEFS